MYTPNDVWWPKPGDKLLVVNEKTGVTSHARTGDILQVLTVEKELNIVEFTTCRCSRSDGRGCRWSWKDSHSQLFQLYEEMKPITPEEIMKAIPLPDPDDALGFFKRTT
jgi:hypothetical protein